MLEELYLSEALYRSMLDVHEDGEHVQNRINSLRGDENNSETEKRPMQKKENMTRTE